MVTYNRRFGAVVGRNCGGHWRRKDGLEVQVGEAIRREAESNHVQALVDVLALALHGADLVSVKLFGRVMWPDQHLHVGTRTQLLKRCIGVSRVDSFFNDR